MNKPHFILLSILTVGILFPSFAHAATISVPTANALKIIQDDSNSRLIEPCGEPLFTTTKYVAGIEVEESRLATGKRLVEVQRYSPSGGEDSFSYYICPSDVITKIQAENSSISTIPKLLISAFEWIVALINSFLTWVLSWAGYLLVIMIGQGKFITSDIVRQAWPFVQGVANLGFIFALLYIALATTLRMEPVNISIQKLLPKLLIAALLVNFSLVIGGLLIDTSRLVMAAEIKLMGNGSLDYNNFTTELVKASNNSAVTLASMNVIDSSNGSAIVLKMIQSVVFLCLLTAAITVIAVNLFIRYVALLILLILSPLAYLALALPNTSKYSSQWWGMFIKWLLYGPIVLFFLIIITRVQNVDIQLSSTLSENKQFVAFFNQFIHFAIVIALFFIGNSVAKKAAGMGSDAVMGFAKKNPRAALIAGASLASGGLLGGAAAALLTSKAAKNNIYRPVRDFANELSPKSIYDDKGNLKKGKSSTGTRWAQSVKSTVSSKERGFRSQINQQQAAYSANPGAYNSAAQGPAAVFSVKNLTDASFVSNIPPDLLTQLMRNGSTDQLNSLAAVIAKDKDGKIGKDQIKTIIDSATQGSAEHRTVLTSIASKPKHANKLGDAQMAKMMSFHPEVTKSLLKSLATEDKE